MILKSPDNPLVTISVLGICRRCKHYHPVQATPDAFGRLAFEWLHKHKRCNEEFPGSVEFLSPQRIIPKGFDDRIFEDAGIGPQWLDWKANSDVKIAYAADAAFTITLASLASSATWVAGQEATSVSNGTNKYLDYEITGKVTTGTTPTAGEFRLYGIKPINDTPTWPDVFDGTNSAETITNTNIRDSLPLLWSGTNSTASDVGYPIVSALTLAQCWGIVPDNFTVFLAHSTVAALNATAGNHEISYRGIFATVV